MSFDSKVFKVGNGYVFDARDDLSQLKTLLINRGNLRKIDSAYPVCLTSLPPVDSAPDDVLTSVFSDGILLLNPKDRLQTKSILLPEGVGPWDIVYANFPSS